LDIRFILSLIEVVDTGSIAAAARNQMLTPAAVSQRVKALEASLGCKLLSRAGHTAKPTSECLKVLPRLKRLISEVEALQSDLDETGLTGELKVGAISTVLTGLIPIAIQYLTVSTPKLNLQIFPGTSAHLYNQLIAKKVDVIIVVTPPFTIPKYLKQTYLYSEQLGFICSKNNELGMNESLLAKPYIQYNRTAWGGAIANTYLVDNNIQTKLVCEIDSLESIVLMVRREMGVSLMPIWRGLEEMGDNIKVLPISGKKYQRQITFISHRQVGKEPLIKVFLDAILKITQESTEFLNTHIS
jgi:DNA-binding transcriptional LysR family regulator